MKIRFADYRDIDEIVRLSRLMPNITLGANEALLKDLLKRLMKRDTVCTLAEEDARTIGMILFAKDSSLDGLITLKMILKLLIGKYGPMKIRTYLNARKMRKLIRDSYHGLMVAVEPEYRKKGVATSLWRAASKRMKGKVTLLIDSENKSSMSFAKERIGAKKVKEISGLFEKGKSWFLYVKEL